MAALASATSLYYNIALVGLLKLSWSDSPGLLLDSWLERRFERTIRCLLQSQNTNLSHMLPSIVAEEEPMRLHPAFVTGSLGLVLIGAIAGAADAAPARRPASHAAGGQVMQTSAPVPAAGPTGSTEFRPTRVFGVDRAQTLLPDVSVLSLSATGLGLDYGIANNAEVGLNANLDLAGIGGPFGAGFGLGATGKYRFVNADNLGVAGTAGVQLNKTAAPGSPIQPSIGVGLPVSFWIGNNAGIHVVPAVAVATDATNTTTTVFGTGLAYELELNPTWRLMLADTINFSGGMNNAYEAGVRIGMTPNVTLNVSVLNGNLNFGGTPQVSGAANVTLFNLTAYFGGHAGDVRSSLGL